MAISFITALETQVGTASATWTITKPSMTDGDLIVIALTTSTNHVVNTGLDNGFLNGITQDAGADSSVSFIYKIASGEGTGSWTENNLFNATEDGHAIVLIYRGVDSSDPIPSATRASTTTSGTSIAGPAVTTPVDNCFVVQIVGTDPATGAYQATPDTSPTGIERFDAKGPSSLSYTAIQDTLQTTAGSVTLHMTALTSDSYASVILGIRPSTGAPAETYPAGYSRQMQNSLLRM